MAKLSKSQLASIKKQVKSYKDSNEIKKSTSKKQQIKTIKKEVKSNSSVKRKSKKVTWSIDIGDLVEYKNDKCIVVDLINKNQEKSSTLRGSAAIIVNSSGPKLVEVITLKKL